MSPDSGFVALVWSPPAHPVRLAQNCGHTQLRIKMTASYVHCYEDITYEFVHTYTYVYIYTFIHKNLHIHIHSDLPWHLQILHVYDVWPWELGHSWCFPRLVPWRGGEGLGGPGSYIYIFIPCMTFDQWELGHSWCFPRLVGSRVQVDILTRRSAVPMLCRQGK